MLAMHSHSTEQKSNEDEANIELSNLSDVMKESWISGETDGVKDVLTSNNIIAKLSADLVPDEVANQLVDAAVEAAGQDRGRLASMINAILSSCCGSDDDGDEGHPQIASAILYLMDEMHETDDTTMVAPDIVSLSLVYYSLHQQSHQYQEYESECETILERAQQVAKKLARSQRRKGMAAERRRRGNNASGVLDAKEVESQLQSLYGPDIRILHETSDVIVMVKPAGMVCYHTKKTSAGKITSSRKKKSRAANANNSGNDGVKQLDISLVDSLLDIPISLSTLNPTARGIVHRLDRGTSGAIILAKTDEVHLKLIALFFLRRIKKKYLALVPGCECTELDNKPPPLTIGSTGTIDAPVDGRPARSTYRVVGEYGKQPQQLSLSPPESLLLQVETLTGRKHQVRVHCASLGRPIFLDELYSSSKSESKSKTKEKGQKK
ncbi:hypothetical protein ACHAXR_005212 [Thalassiosira sp. AJA248-18]